MQRELEFNLDELFHDVTQEEIEWFESLRDLIDAAKLLGSMVDGGESAKGYPAINWALSEVSALRAKK